MNEYYIATALLFPLIALAISFYCLSVVGKKNASTQSLQDQVGKKVIVRTYSAGCWFGTLDKKTDSEVILKNARRMYYWWAAKSISLSGVALYGIHHDKSTIVPPVPEVDLPFIEILTCTPVAVASLESAPHAEAQ